MNRLIRWYNKNRKLFWITIVVAIIVIKVPRALNEYAKDKKNVSSSITNNTTTYSNNNYSIISEENVKEEENTENINLISNFIEYCNNGNIDKAYEILSNKCKEVLYPTLNEFENKYYKKIFNNKKSYNVQAWVSGESSYTYKIDLKEDILSTGNANSESIEDFYTIVYEGESYKLNINNYIDSVLINKIKEANEAKIAVLSKDVFIDYEIYNIYVTSKMRKIYIIR